MSTTTVEVINAPASPLAELSASSSITSRPNQPVFPAEDAQHEDISKGKTVVVISSVTCITGISSLLAGVVTVCIPAMAKDVNLEGNLLLWPASVYALTCGCTLLLSGAMADLFGARQLYLLGCFLQSAFTLACGLAKTGIQLIMFRAFAGIAISMCLPSAVSIITHAFPSGKRRNIAFASMGGGQPIGFSVGLSVGGVFTDTIGWRWGFHIAAIINTVIFLIALKWLPSIGKREPVTWNRFLTEVDWIGAFLASGFLAMVSYVLAVMTESLSDIKKPANIALLVVSGVLIGSFIGWVERQERLGRPAIIPNSLWKNRSFTSICVSVFMVWGAFNATEQLSSFYLQYVQRLSAIDTSVRFLPAPVGGVLANVVAGLVVHRVRADLAILIAVALAALSPILMAVADPAWNYWYCIFWAMFMNAIGADTLFTISNLLITSLFPSRTQGVAGGVYNTIAQIGKSVGLASSGAIASAVTAKSGVADKESPTALLEGYRASFWYCFALYGATLLVTIWGLRKIGKVGVKKE
ncbi:putative MFS-type transporter [Colletotrichum siamense]|uniref:putative MFS-type transporter n=1 Tax=Colletotrichum siamense TaxID=690259 RepID=UPI001872E339|nr:putative MFS-type transporter [Colletotrichum siamense]KAI8160935.1 putative MFS-type transporter [Colletotrichum sp. SAR 10_71]KAI8161963.1 putative MFS-type transporter [Colletotrichum sp. SAR 10_65]KAI8177324.1 putative MFS-type transporter [Colletotrichum sp. SAR 10_70]KAI8181246.1 putative MFS-type transporter [Colletotrichum sp. SAR 10_75]KAI8208826.1 putative MFS-type transporter [Colletotrichum sp. SAR 10_76]KAI8228492.1 putative MFS-type transporter [Colletotrichum sp. SAR 10_86]